MLRRLSPLLIAILLLGSFMITVSSPAAFAECTGAINKTTGVCKIGGGGSEIIGGGDDGGSSSGKVPGPGRQCRYAGDVIPCSKYGGKWNSSQQCYVKAMDPQPPKSDEVWDGHKDGIILTCLRPGGQYNNGTALVPYWAVDVAPPPPDPRQIAYQLLAEIRLQAGTIGITPTKPLADGGYGIIGIPSYLWVANPGASTTGPVKRSRTVAGYTVTISAQLDQVAYDMGNGTTVTCAGINAPGIPYESRFGKTPSTVCGYVYEQPGRYTVTARSTWNVEWWGIGETGTISFTVQRNLTIEMREVQVINKRPR